MRAGNVNVAARTTSPVLIEMSDMSPQLRVPAIACGGAPGGTASSQAYGESDWSGVISGTLGPAEGTLLGAWRRDVDGSFGEYVGVCRRL